FEQLPDRGDGLRPRRPVWDRRKGRHRFEEQPRLLVVPGPVKDGAIGPEHRVINNGLQVTDAVPVGAGVYGGHAPAGRPRRHVHRAVLGFTGHNPLGVGRESFAEQRRRQGFDARRERSADSLGGRTHVAYYVDQHSAALIDALVADQGGDGGRVDFVLLG